MLLVTDVLTASHLTVLAACASCLCPYCDGDYWKIFFAMQVSVNHPHLFSNAQTHGYLPEHREMTDGNSVCYVLAAETSMQAVPAGRYVPHAKVCNNIQQHKLTEIKWFRTKINKVLLPPYSLDMMHTLLLQELLLEGKSWQKKKIKVRGYLPFLSKQHWKELYTVVSQKHFFRRGSVKRSSLDLVKQNETGALTVLGTSLYIEKNKSSNSFLFSSWFHRKFKHLHICMQILLLIIYCFSEQWWNDWSDFAEPRPHTILKTFYEILVWSSHQSHILSLL